MNNIETLIIGGGISGLTSAHYIANANKKVFIIEQSKTPGGCIDTVSHENFFIELGAHTIYNSYGTILEILSTLNLTNSLIKQLKPPFKYGGGIIFIHY